MALFEVFIPGKEPGMPNVTLTVDAQNWIGALRSGLKSIGEGQEAIANVMCDIKDDNSIHVTDVATRRVFRLREVPAKAAVPASADVPVDSRGDPKTMPEGPRPISMPSAPAVGAAADADETLRNVRPPEFEAQPRTLIEFPVQSTAAPKVALPNAESSVAWTKMPGPAAEPAIPSPAPAPAPSPTPAPAAPPPAAVAPLPAAPSPMIAKPTARPMSISDAPTMELPKTTAGAGTAPATGATAGATPHRPTSVPPTPRGVPAPAPKRPSGQFSSAAEPKSREVTAPQPTDPRIGRAADVAAKPMATVSSPSGSAKTQVPVDVQDAIAAVFDATQDLYMEPALSPQHVADKLLDIALQHIPAEAGTFYIADVNGHELEFAAVRGPKADALKRSGVTVKVGQGIIGFCAQEGVCLAVSDIQKDPRFYAAIAKTIDYQPRDTLCASAEKEGRLWGAVQLINSKGGFEAAHMEVLRFIGLTAAAMLERIDDRG